MKPSEFLSPYTFTSHIIIIKLSGDYDLSMNNKSTCFKVSNIYGGIFLPLYKPNIEEILRVNVTSTIVKKKLAIIADSSTLGISLEGQIRTKHKLIIMGNLNYDITYSPANLQQGVHTIQITIPICDYITLPNQLNSQSIISPHVVIQDVYIDRVDDRYYYINAVFMLLADIF